MNKIISITMLFFCSGTLFAINDLETSKKGKYTTWLEALEALAGKADQFQQNGQTLKAMNLYCNLLKADYHQEFKRQILMKIVSLRLREHDVGTFLLKNSHTI